MKIGICGPSGTGKSTLARFISEEYNLLYTEQSGELMIPKILLDELKLKYGYRGKDHRQIIELSNRFPEFGYQYQKLLMEARADFIMMNDNFVIDRTPVDNLVYFLIQCSHNQDSCKITNYIAKCRKVFSELTHIIFVNFCLPIEKEIENNGCRVDNWHYQMMSNAVFTHTYKLYFRYLEKHNNIRCLDINVWSDFDYRKDLVKNWLNTEVDKKDELKLGGDFFGI